MSDSAEHERQQIRAQKARALQQRLESNGETEEHSPTAPIDIEDQAHLDETIASHSLVLVDCYADWCGPCQLLEPTIESIANDTAATVAKVNVDRHQDIARQLGARGVPTLVLFHEGDAVDRLVGLQDRGTLVNRIESI